MKKIISSFVLIILFLSISATAAVELNTASIKELESLHGIGPARAHDIVKYRESNGGFKSIDELKNVKGIGDSTFEAIKKDLSVWEPYWTPN